MKSENLHGEYERDKKLTAEQEVSNSEKRCPREKCLEALTAKQPLTLPSQLSIDVPLPINVP